VPLILEDPMLRFGKLYHAGLLFTLVGCESGVTAPPDSAPVPDAAPVPAATASASSAGGWESGVIVEEFVYPNPCTGEMATYTFTGSMKVEERGGFYLLVAHGWVTTSDGWSGRFNRTKVIIDGTVYSVHFHDVELQADPSGPKQLWSVGMGHETLAGGVTHDYFERYGASGCVG